MVARACCICAHRRRAYLFPPEASWGGRLGGLRHGVPHLSVVCFWRACWIGKRTDCTLRTPGSQQCGVFYA